MDLITSYHDLTEVAKAVTGASPNMLHVHVGMAIYLGGQVLLGSRRASWLALFLVVEIELFNEVMNYFFYGSWRWDDTLSDIALTLMWPAMCVLVGTYRRRRWTRKRARRTVLMEQLAVPSRA